MTKTKTKEPDVSLADWLWRAEPGKPAPRVWFLADAARDERIYPLLQSSWLDFAGLYDGDLPLEFRRAAPYLVELERGAEETHEILELGWGDAWGVFFHAAAGLAELKEHFRQFLVARDERGRQMFFRFYDPRVLRTYLPTCTRSELERFFGPVETFLMEGETPEKRLVFRLGPPRRRDGRALDA